MTYKTISQIMRMLELYKSSSHTPQDKERVKRVPRRAPGIEKIEPTDRAIDRLVNELYGLTDVRSMWWREDSPIKP